MGKTTLVLRLYDRYRNRVSVAGIVTQEVKQAEVRIGFKIRDLTSQNEGWLARVSGATGPRIGKYTVESSDLETVAVRALKDATVGGAELILVDEIGPMEMTSPTFAYAVSELFRTKKTIVATVKYGSRYAEVEELSKRGSAITVTLKHESRDRVAEQIITKLDAWLSLPGE